MCVKSVISPYLLTLLRNNCLVVKPRDSTLLLSALVYLTYTLHSRNFFKLVIASFMQWTAMQVFNGQKLFIAALLGVHTAHTTVQDTGLVVSAAHAQCLSY
jgi:hypothetical protein